MSDVADFGSLKWVMYAAELQEIVHRHGISFRRFFDDSQLSRHMSVDDLYAGKRAMLDCIADILFWCNYRKLKINSETFEIIWLAPDSGLLN